MRIGILTFHRAINYGAFLQCFALKTYLEANSNRVEIIDYWPKEHEDCYALFSKSEFKTLPFARKLYFLLKFVFRYNRAMKRKKKMERLQQCFLSLASVPKYRKGCDLKEVDYDYVFYGSDQIWWKSKNKLYKGFDSVYWGEYIPSKIRKVAYSASMGIIDLFEPDKKEISSHLHNFSSIAVREDVLKETIAPLTNKYIQVTIDPVFLLDKEEWKKYMKKGNSVGEYILVFNLMHANNASSIAKKLSDRYNCPIREITSSVQPFRFGNGLYQSLDAFEFIDMIANAKCVVTSSFHGTAFSIIFEKQFVSIGMLNNSSRVLSLLNSLGISNRYLADTVSVPSSEIDYDVVTKRMIQFKKQSQNFIDSAIHTNA